MTTSRSEDVVVGLITAVIVLPWIAWTLHRGLRSGRLPIGGGHVVLADRPAAFRTLLFFYTGVAVMAVVISLDLLFGLDVRDAL